MKTKSKTTSDFTVELSAKETGDILLDVVTQRLNADGKLGKRLSATAKDLAGLSAEIKMSFQKEEEA
jgi:hypothetical protein